MAETSVLLAPGAEDNGLCGMLADLVRQNLESKPHKRRDFDQIRGSVGIVAEDAEVALTLRFDGGKLTLHDGIVGVPDVTIRGPADSIVALSNVPLMRGLPIAGRKDVEGKKVVDGMMKSMRDGTLQIHGALLHLPMMMRLTRVMSVNG